ncbi:hypothetical protein EJ110_NYTH15645 [Nymphaea thermarum]|nr:hypothetical protein EJ110_NYTH15645 [Nymphaea thermarum]
MADQTASMGQLSMNNHLTEKSMPQDLMKPMEEVDLLPQIRHKSEQASLSSCFPAIAKKMIRRCNWVVCFRKLAGLRNVARGDPRPQTRCLVCLQVHGIRNLPQCMNGFNLRLNWRRADGKGEETGAVKVVDGSADFDEVFLQYYDIPCNLKNFTLWVSSNEANESEMGCFEVELNGLVVNSCSNFGGKTKHFNLLGKAEGGVLTISFNYRVFHAEVHDVKADACSSGFKGSTSSCFSCLPGFMKGKSHQLNRVSSLESNFGFITIDHSKEVHQAVEDESDFITIEKGLHSLITCAGKLENDGKKENKELDNEEEVLKIGNLSCLTAGTEEEYEVELVEDEFLKMLEMEEDLDFESVMREAEVEIMKATQIWGHRKEATDIEKDEFEDLIKKWGLDEHSFQMTSSLEDFIAFDLCFLLVVLFPLLGLLRLPVLEQLRPPLPKEDGRPKLLLEVSESKQASSTSSLIRSLDMMSKDSQHVGMSDLVSSAVVGSVVAELLKATLEAGKATKNFRVFMGQSQRTVEHLQVALENVKQLEEQVRDSRLKDKARRLNMNELSDCLEQGISLIDKCSKLSSWNIWKRYTYAKKLMKLDTRLLSGFLDVILNAIFEQRETSAVEYSEKTNREVLG